MADHNGADSGTPTTRSPRSEGLLARWQRPRTPEEEEAYRRAEAEDRERERRTAEAYHQELLRALARTLGPRYGPKRCSLDTFEARTPAQRAVKQRLAELFISWPKPLLEGRGLVFLGGVGGGKDHLMAAALYEAAGKHRAACKWVNGLDLFGDARDRIARKECESEQVEELTGTDILAISDPLPPGGSLTDWQINLLLRVIDRRYRDMRPIFVTVNADDERDADERLTAPVWDRLQECCEVVKCCWASYRGRKQKGA
jgi:DNA replication protein DnaC